MLNLEQGIKLAYDKLHEPAIHGNQINAVCPFCGSPKKKFYMNKDTGLFDCKSGKCQAKGHINNLLEKLGISDRVEFKGDTEKAEKKKINVDVSKFQELKEDDKIVEYMISRGITYETLRDTGCMRKGSALVMPTYRNDEIVGICYRTPEKQIWQEAGSGQYLWNRNNLDKNKKRIYITEGRCLSGDTEVLTQRGWVRLDEFDVENDLVTQVNNDKTAEFVEPIAYIENKNRQEIWGYKNRNYSFCGTPQHRVALWGRDNCSVTIDELQNIPNTKHNHIIPTAVTIDGDGIPLSNDEIALNIAIQADGTIDYRKNGNRYVRISFKRERKIRRFRELIHRLNIEHIETRHASGHTFFGFTAPDYIYGKEFNIEWTYKMSLAQRRFFIDEMIHWDGNRVPNRQQVEYVSTNKKNAEFMQIVASTCGYHSTIIARDRKDRGWNMAYKVSVLLSKNSVSWQNMDRYKAKKTVDAVYCVQVPSGMILIRHNGKISVTGNCDALTLIEMGYGNVVSMPNGASSHEWINQEWNLLKEFEEIVLLYDNDTPGKTGFEQAKTRLDFATLFVANLGKYKDINEAYMEDSSFLYEAINNIKEIQLDGFVSLDGVSTSDGVGAELYSCGIPQFDRIFGGVRLGESTIIASSSGVGKSTVLCNFVKGILSQDEKVGLFSGELTNASLKAWIYAVIGGSQAVNLDPHPFRQGEFITSIKPEYEHQIDKKVRGRLWIYDGGKSNAYIMLKNFSALNKRFGVKYFFIDNLSILDMAVKGMGQYEAEDHFAKVLAEFCRTHKCHVFLFAHPTKQNLNTDADFIDRSGRVKPIQRYDQYSVRGSATLVNLSHNIMFLMRAKEWEKQFFIQNMKDAYVKANQVSVFNAEVLPLLKDEFSLFAYLVKNRGSGKTFEDALFGYDANTRRIYGLLTKNEDLKREVELDEEDIDEQELEISYEDF